MNPERRQRLLGVMQSGGTDQRVTRVTGVTLALALLQAGGGTPLSPGSPGSAVTRDTRCHPVTRQDGDVEGDERRVTAKDRNAVDGAHPDPAEIEERAAIAQVEGGFPARFALAFAHLQLQAPSGLDTATWEQAVDAMGRVLDRCRSEAEVGAWSE